jgi:predicted lactoylglutathione lyase
MGIKIFVNLPVKDLEASKAFFGKLGVSFNPQFTDETAACMVLSEENYVMLLTHAKFAEFTTKPVADATKSTEVLIAISQDSRPDVDRMVDKAVKAGGVEPRPAADYGFMFQRAFEDLDGHIWEVIWMDPSAVEPQN